MNLPADHKLTPKRTSVRTVKQFYVAFEEEGWASMTICNATGIINVMSDWLNGSYRWHVGQQGGLTMEEFVAKHASKQLYACDYLTCKLFGDSTGEAHIFLEDETKESFRKEIREARKTGRIDSDKAREMYEAVREIEEHRIPDVLHEISDWYEAVRYGKSPRWYVMRDRVLPALVAMVKAEVDRANPAPDPSPVDSVQLGGRAA